MDLVPLKLVPVEVFGGEEGGEEPFTYGLNDAVQSWSDCNRAIGQIYRVDESNSFRIEGESVTVYVERKNLDWFKKRWGEDFERLSQNDNS